MYENHFGFTELPFSVSPDPRFFYSNPVYREALVTLHYGIEARKGFVIITGEAGTGKTTLLRMLMHNLDSAIHTAFVFNPRLTFTALLRFILNDLGVTSSAKDRLTLTEQLNGYLIEQLKKGHTVALLVDEAQALSDEILEELRLLSNLETDQEKLIQIVLMGQPELENKLDQPELRQLKQRVTLRCRLLPLTRDEVGLYITSRVKTAGYEGKELFVPEAVERITHYSNGIPRLVNVVCDNALVIASAASKEQVRAEMIDEVAHDLKLIGKPKVKAERATTDVKLPEDLREASRPMQAKTAVTDEPWHSDFEPRRGPVYNQPQHRTFTGLGICVLLVIALLAGAGMALYAQQSGALAALDVKFKNLAGIGIKDRDRVGLPRENPEPVPPDLSTEVLKETPGYKLPNLQEIPESRESERPPPELSQNNATVPQGAKPGETAIPEPATANQITKNPKNPAPTSPDPTAKERPLKSPYNVPPTAEQLEFEILKAIANRAIRGVEVSVRDGTVYLAGRVATEQQKLAAAQAARSVPGVKEVRDQIIVNSFGPETGDGAS